MFRHRTCLTFCVLVSVVTVFLMDQYVSRIKRSPFFVTFGGLAAAPHVQNVSSASLQTAPQSLPRSAVSVKSRITCRQPQFAEPRLPVTPLISYPGAGSTWFRHLLQVASGLLTGSTYPDPVLEKNGFPGERHRDGTVLVVKQHDPPSVHSPFTLPRFDRAVLLMRDPTAAGKAEFNRLKSSHIGHASEKKLQEDLPKFLKDTLPRWKDIYLTSLDMKQPVILVEYEDLRNDMKAEMTKVLRFLNVTFTDFDIECMVRNSEGNFHRKAKQSSVSVNLDKGYLKDAEEAKMEVRRRYQQRLRLRNIPASHRAPET